jgi:hypothetical protein
MRKLVVTILLVFAAMSLKGQDENLTLQLRGILFSDFIDTLEKSAPVRIYFYNKWVDTLTLAVSARDMPLSQVLDRTLTREGLSFFITEDNRVIISKGYSIKTKFGEEYLSYLKNSLALQDTSLRRLSPASKDAGAVSDESKIFRIGNRSSGERGTTAVLSGTIRNNSDGGYVVGAIVYVGKLRAGVMTNNAGYYSITLPRGQYQVEYRMMGMKTTRRNVIIYSDGVLDVGMSDEQNVIEPVIIKGTRDNIKEVRTGIEQINLKMLRQIPLGLGEADIIKSSLMLPGVQTVGEASAGFNVRGGSTDENLVFLNNAPVMNTSHLFGFFSAFNPDLATDITLYKSGMPAKYGGRLSSVMVINPADGNREKINVSGGISPVAGRILVEGPLPYEGTTFIIGARTTYSDWLLGLFDDYKISHSSAGFYDLQGSVNHTFNEKNTVSLSGYLSRDRFNYYTETAFRYGNLAATLKWDHAFSNKLSGKFYAILSDYKYKVNYYGDSTRYNSIYYKLDQKIIRGDFLCSSIEKHKMEFGIDAAFYTLDPGKREPFGDYSVVPPKVIEKEQAVEPALYFSDEIEITPLLSVSAGLRSTLFTSFGPGTAYRYFENSEISQDNISDTIKYRPGEVMSFYPGFDYRFSARYILSSRSSVKLNAQRVHQYIHMISNTTSISPTDIWKISNSYIKPERSDQVSVGYYYNFSKRGIETSVEVYYKWLDNILDYKGGAVLVMNDHLETDIISSNGKAYGIELMFRKEAGAVTGWISYTWSRALLRTSGEYPGETVNGGAWFPADYDKPHDLKMVANAKVTRRFNFTANFNYSTGRPITFPVAFFVFNNSDNVYYSQRNAYRMPDYIRLDMAVTLNGNLKARKLNHSSLTFSVYNVLGRKNPYSIYFRNEGGTIKGYQLTIFGQPVMMLTYNFRIMGNASGDF